MSRPVAVLVAGGELTLGRGLRWGLLVARDRSFACDNYVYRVLSGLSGFHASVFMFPAPVGAR